MDSVKVFVLYHKLAPIFKSDVFVPIQTGCSMNQPIAGFYHDNVGDNISSKNPYLGELTGNYWVWKNYLPSHPEVQYIGFCHYRRNWNFRKKGQTEDSGFCHKTTYSSYRKLFERQSSEFAVRETLAGFDVLLPDKVSFAAYGQTIERNYLESGHPYEGWQAFSRIMQDLYPETKNSFQRFRLDSEGYFCLNYIMRRELFCDFMTWLFSILDRLELEVDLSGYTTYATQRTSAYLAERFFNVWLDVRKQTHELKIRECRAYLLSEPSADFRRQCIVDMLVRFYHHYVRNYLRRMQDINRRD